MTALYQLFHANTDLDPKTLQVLVQHIERNNLPGFDYIEFKQSVAKLEAMLPDKGTAIRSAFATASTLGVTKEKLLETAAHYRSLLDDERKQFDNITARHIETKVESKILEANALSDKIADWQEEITKLQQQIESARASIVQSDHNRKVELDKINTAKAHFENAYKHLFSVIEDDIQNIQSQL
jgi:chromosome segregation ATPase